ncbi:hypothetical protein [Pseudomonas sp. dw_358]|uniref:hypothetical protein n=1 Tax=Pseudomonas sp. dw_358 TaxID=2720083 RepID=UPI002116ED75|nr:hypothetical protein [Pseudomonas sp. dw_358]
MDRNLVNITSPLTIIALFAAIIEASALASLPFLNDDSQDIYTWFLVGFPPFLTLLFFVTLNFNSKAFYPSPETPSSSAAPCHPRADTPAANNAVVILLGDQYFCNLTRQSLAAPLKKLDHLHHLKTRVIAWNRETAGEALISALTKNQIEQH